MRTFPTVILPIFFQAPTVTQLHAGNFWSSPGIVTLLSEAKLTRHGRRFLGLGVHDWKGTTKMHTQRNGGTGLNWFIVWFGICCLLSIEKALFPPLLFLDPETRAQVRAICMSPSPKVQKFQHEILHANLLRDALICFSENAFSSLCASSGPKGVEGARGRLPDALPPDPPFRDSLLHRSLHLPAGLRPRRPPRRPRLRHHHRYLFFSLLAPEMAEFDLSMSNVSVYLLLKLWNVSSSLVFPQANNNRSSNRDHHRYLCGIFALKKFPPLALPPPLFTPNPLRNHHFIRHFGGENLSQTP